MVNDAFCLQFSYIDGSIQRSVIPLLMRWSYVWFTLNHQYVFINDSVYQVVQEGALISLKWSFGVHIGMVIIVVPIGLCYIKSVTMIFILN